MNEETITLSDKLKEDIITVISDIISDAEQDDLNVLGIILAGLTMSNEIATKMLIELERVQQVAAKNAFVKRYNATPWPTPDDIAEAIRLGIGKPVPTVKEARSSARPTQRCR
jgi:hypothetical protein